jgi:hypothetical protein
MATRSQAASFAGSLKALTLLSALPFHDASPRLRASAAKWKKPL